MNTIKYVFLEEIGNVLKYSMFNNFNVNGEMSIIR